MYTAAMRPPATTVSMSSNRRGSAASIGNSHTSTKRNSISSSVTRGSSLRMSSTTVPTTLTRRNSIMTTQSSVPSEAGQSSMTLPPEDPIRTTFKLKFPNHIHTFSPQFSSVIGHVELEFLSDLPAIVSIDIGLKGDSLAIVRETSASKGKSSTRDHYYEKPLFDKTTNVFTTVVSEGSDLFKGEFSAYDFTLEFPNAHNLPSSCHEVSSKFTYADLSTEGIISVRYFVYLRVHCFSQATGALESIEYTLPINFQGNDISKMLC
ncbi:unnamed protein product [Ambrosiozyma monospora]|uniref:Unnamed protein product n=1 Tax=Ambrosiozyma monospora TaxID=43982 RepID=A0ACB5T4T2_AMBMO|nr:unnamed protein product [Ambrosiozyma monospora]